MQDLLKNQRLAQSQVQTYTQALGLCHLGVIPDVIPRCERHTHIAGAPGVDPLDALIAELERIEGQETTIQDAIAHNVAVVVHPRPEVQNHEIILLNIPLSSSAKACCQSLTSA